MTYHPPGFDEALEHATAVATMSPCAKSKRGVTLWHPGTALWWSGYNAPALGTCTATDACRRSCRQINVHAEQMALIKAGRTNGRGAESAELLHIKVVPIDDETAYFDGDAVTASFRREPSGLPSCAECSKLMLYAGVEGVWLLHTAGWHRYTAREFHELTLDRLNLHRSTR